MMAKSEAPRATSRWVRIPAGWSWISRSMPMVAPKIAARRSRPPSSAWSRPSVGTLGRPRAGDDAGGALGHGHPDRRAARPTGRGRAGDVDGDELLASEARLDRRALAGRGMLGGRARSE